MKAALVLVESDFSDTQAEMLKKFGTYALAAAAKQNLSIESLNRGAYLIRGDNLLRALAILVTHAESQKLNLHTLFFESDPPFVLTAFPTEKPA